MDVLFRVIWVESQCEVFPNLSSYQSRGIEVELLGAKVVRIHSSSFKENNVISFTVNGTEDRKLVLEALFKIERAAIFGRWRRRCKALHL